MKYLIIIPAYKELKNLVILVPKLINKVNSIKNNQDKILKHKLSKVNIDIFIMFSDNKKNIDSFNKFLNEIQNKINGLNISMYDNNKKNDKVINLIIKFYYERKDKDFFFNFVFNNFNDYDFFITLDADLQDDLDAIERLIELSFEYDFILGYRYRRKDNYLIKILPSKIANLLFRVVFRIKIHDFNCPVKCFKYKKDLKKIKFKNGCFRFLAYFLIKIFNYSFIEIKVKHYKRKYGKAKFNNFFKRSFEFIKCLFLILFKKIAVLKNEIL